MNLPYTPHTSEDRQEMLAQIGVESMEELLDAVVPKKIGLPSPLNLPSGISEMELSREVKNLSLRNASLEEYTSFLGGGIYDHFVPAVVEHLASRSEFYTAYTPYQAEASQGTLQAIYEYQTVICNLFQMEVSNASMYDGATSLAEAALMAYRIRGGEKILVARNLHPEYYQVILTYTKHLGIRIVQIPYTSEGTSDLNRLEDEMDDKVTAVIVQNPNFFGYLEKAKELEEIVHRFGSLYIICCDPISLGILSSPGECSADIAVAEGQALGSPPSLGGETLGIFATRKGFLRQVPGRIVGQAKDRKGERGFVLVLQTREQHIRREKATSNICTNQALNAMKACIYLSCLGEEGLKKVAGLCLGNSHYLKRRIEQLPGYSSPFSAPFFKEFVIKTSIPSEKINQKLLEARILGGMDLGTFYPELENHLLFCTTEKRTKEELDTLVSLLGDIR
ncbi:aminomethyl-transferring glycine dehydrogenase subunit GcvPA [Candidatus Aerophobetes bacterium]|uniref:Probable glycine dehydrogenase (decarboxylating) subunit 1 n=1 Tax=Aerophobetes bacterium TaxID=2030807 RepID=A0A523QKJ8_UNCAE|nr:MAG: aminomethyl-transferring glycine dehydrogenase subunit GcvPA [Candidatus Aerophobetes bacterium]